MPGEISNAQESRKRTLKFFFIRSTVVYLVGFPLRMRVLSILLISAGTLDVSTVESRFSEPKGGGTSREITIYHFHATSLSTEADVPGL